MADAEAEPKNERRPTCNASNHKLVIFLAIVYAISTSYVIVASMEATRWVVKSSLSDTTAIILIVVSGCISGAMTLYLVSYGPLWISLALYNFTDTVIPFLYWVFLRILGYIIFILTAVYLILWLVYAVQSPIQYMQAMYFYIDLVPPMIKANLEYHGGFLTNATMSAFFFMFIAAVFPTARGVFIAWIALRTVFYMLRPKFKLATRFLQWRFKGRPYDKQLMNFMDVSDKSLARHMLQNHTIICGDAGFPAAALIVATVARFCGATEWTRIRVPSNYFGDGTFESQLIRILNCKPLEFYEPLRDGEIAIMARSDLVGHPRIVRELKECKDGSYQAFQCQSTPPTGFLRFFYIFDIVDHALFDWQSLQLLAGVAHLFNIYMLSKPPLEFKRLVHTK